jgi:uncharacterized protein (TIGR03435 family)
MTSRFDVGVAGLMAFGIMAVPGIRAQSPAAGAPPPTFEVASIKPNTSDGPGAEMYPSKSQLKLVNYSLKQLIQAAYQVKDYAYAGPPWLDSQRFDIFAKLPPDAKADQFPAMMQTLLRERCKLVVHREARVMTALALVVDKNGLRIKPVEADPDGTSSESSGRTMVKASKVSMARLADLLSSAMDRPVKDLTELSGIYDINLKWMPDDAPPVDATRGDAAGGADRQSPRGSGLATSVFSAVQELGLKLEARKLPIEVLVVDHAEKPSEN